MKKTTKLGLVMAVVLVIGIGAITVSNGSISADTLYYSSKDRQAKSAWSYWQQFLPVIGKSANLTSNQEKESPSATAKATTSNKTENKSVINSTNSPTTANQTTKSYALLPGIVSSPYCSTQPSALPSPDSSSQQGFSSASKNWVSYTGYLTANTYDQALRLALTNYNYALVLKDQPNTHIYVNDMMAHICAIPFDQVKNQRFLVKLSGNTFGDDPTRLVAQVMEILTDPEFTGPVINTVQTSAIPTLTTMPNEISLQSGQTYTITGKDFGPEPQVIIRISAPGSSQLTEFRASLYSEDNGTVIHFPVLINHWPWTQIYDNGTTVSYPAKLTVINTSMGYNPVVKVPADRESNALNFTLKLR